jgi:hypothetical protein
VTSNSVLRDTELRLSFWRDGSTKAERLAAAALRLSGYEEIDPQSPLGGPDGKKDVLCTKGGLTWVAAVHFPVGPMSFSTTKKKFKSDLAGAPAGPQGFVFVTNVPFGEGGSVRETYPTSAGSRPLTTLPKLASPIVTVSLGGGSAIDLPSTSGEDKCVHFFLER